MATYTTNYELKKPDYTDLVDIADFNSNADIIDGVLGSAVSDRTSYDNSYSGLNSENVQDAIDEIVGLSPIANVSNFAGTSSYTNISLTWTNATNSTGVTLFYSTSNISNFTYENCVSSATQIYSGTGTSYNHTGLSLNTTYYYKIFSSFEHFGIKYSTGVSLTKNTGNLPASGKALSIYSWEEIDIISRYSDPSTYWSVGDEKDFVYAPSGETLTIQIYGFNHDTLSSDGVSKAGITFGMKHLMATTRRMNSTNVNAGGWGSCEMRSWVTGTLIGQLPSDLQSVLKTVNKLTSAGSQSATINTTQDKVFLFSEIECFSSRTNSFAGEGSTYPIFTSNASRIKKLSNGSGVDTIWWMRSPWASGSYQYCAMNTDGSSNYLSSSVAYGACFGFCV